MKLVNGVSDTVIAKEFKLSVFALYRHRESHLPKLMVKGKELEEITNADVLLSRAEKLYNEAWKLLRTAKNSGDVRTALAGVGQASRVIELLARLLGEIKDTKITNVLVHPDVKELLQIVVESLSEYPEAKAHILLALKARFMSNQDAVSIEPSEMN